LVSLSRAASLLPDVAEVKYHLAEALFRTGDLNGARRQLRALFASGAGFKGMEEARALLKKLES
jgi:Tfp pilus assembly protein FimV